MSLKYAKRILSIENHKEWCDKIIQDPVIQLLIRRFRSSKEDSRGIKLTSSPEIDQAYILPPKRIWGGSGGGRLLTWFQSRALTRCRIGDSTVLHAIET